MLQVLVEYLRFKKNKVHFVPNNNCSNDKKNVNTKGNICLTLTLSFFLVFRKMFKYDLGSCAIRLTIHRKSDFGAVNSALLLSVLFPPLF